MQGAVWSGWMTYPNALPISQHPIEDEREG